MQEILFYYKKIHPMNWVYLSSLLTICVYFKYSRFWSVRNLDLAGLLLFAPGLVLVAYGNASPIPSDAQIAIGQFGYIWLFAIGGLFLIRMLMDSLMVRRPLLEPNLSVGGMTFLGVALLIFLMANIANSDPKELEPLPTEIAGIADTVEETPLETDPQQTAATTDAAPQSGLQRYGPRNPILSILPEIITQTYFPGGDGQSSDADRALYDPRRIAAAKSIAILSHLAVIIGMVLIGYHHFDNIKTGIAAAVLYLLLPYTAEMTGRVPHVSARRAFGMGSRHLSAADHCRVFSGTGNRRHLLSALFVAALDQFLLEERGVAILWRYRACSVAFDWNLGHLFRQRCLSGRCPTNARNCSPQADQSSGFLATYRCRLSTTGDCHFRCARRQFCHLASAEESWHADELFGSDDAGLPVLECPWRRPLHGMVSATFTADDLPAQPGRPSRYQHSHNRYSQANRIGWSIGW